MVRKLAANPIAPKVIPFAENLPEVLPKGQIFNLGLLPKEQRDAVAEDLRRWREATIIFEKRKVAVGISAINAANAKIKEGIALFHPEAYREDMRRRLNILKAKLK